MDWTFHRGPVQESSRLRSFRRSSSAPPAASEGHSALRHSSGGSSVIRQLGVLRCRSRYARNCVEIGRRFTALRARPTTYLFALAASPPRTELALSAHSTERPYFALGLSRPVKVPVEFVPRPVYARVELAPSRVGRRLVWADWVQQLHRHAVQPNLGAGVVKLSRYPLTSGSRRFLDWGQRI